MVKHTQRTLPPNRIYRSTSSQPPNFNLKSWPLPIELYPSPKTPLTMPISKHLIGYTKGKAFLVSLLHLTRWMKHFRSLAKEQLHHLSFFKLLTTTNWSQSDLLHICPHSLLQFQSQTRSQGTLKFTCRMENPQIDQKPKTNKCLCPVCLWKCSSYSP